MRADTSRRHQESGRKGIGILLGLLPVRRRVTMKDEMAQFVCGIKASMFCRLESIEKDKGTILPPQRERINLRCIYCERINTYSSQFEEVHHVLDWQFAQAPVTPHRFRCTLWA